MRALAVAAGLGLLLAACGSGTGLTCAELRAPPTRWSSEAAKIYKSELPDLPPSDCNARCKRGFTNSIERLLRKECRNADDDHRPTEAVVDEIHSD
jgi:hypothetical protein